MFENYMCSHTCRRKLRAACKGTERKSSKLYAATAKASARPPTGFTITMFTTISAIPTPTRIWRAPFSAAPSTPILVAAELAGQEPRKVGYADLFISFLF